MNKQLEVLDKTKDLVIDSDYLTVKLDYEYALKNLLPLINRLDFQRNTLNRKYYQRLKQDIIDGCILPPLTIAFDSIELRDSLSKDGLNYEDISGILHENISDGFILDGIQRLNILNEASDDEKFKINNTLYANVIISNSVNKLLYRMIILNNGQKPMSARHQIEILLNRTIEQILIEDKYSEYIFSEKHRVRGDGKSKLKKEVLIKAYLAFSTKSINIDNQKIIESKLNEIISEKIVSSEVKNSNIEFNKIFEFLIELIELSKLDKYEIDLIDWLNNENNIIGLFVGIAKNSDILICSLEDVLKCIDIVEYLIVSINPSKVRVSNIRRKVVSDVISKFEVFLRDEDYKDEYLMEI